MKVVDMLLSVATPYLRLWRSSDLRARLSGRHMTGNTNHREHCFKNGMVSGE